jgi:phage-related baseplate assembly protein
VSLSSLPALQFVDTDPSRVEAEVLQAYEAAAGKTLYPGDPVRLFLESVAYTLAHQRFLIDWTAKQNLLAYAGGAFLDHLGALTATERLPEAAAHTTLRFSLSEAHAAAVLIPAGTRATPDGQLLFATVTAAEIAPGALAVDVTAQCQTAGTAGNGFTAGQINRLVDPVAYVAGVTNVTTSLGGAAVEGDGHYRDRVWRSPEKYAAAGPAGAYEYWAYSAHQQIADAAVYSPAPGLVAVTLLGQDGADPSREMLDAADALLSAQSRRPCTDQVFVRRPDRIAYDVAVTWWLDRADAALASRITAAVTAAVDGYCAWQRGRIGRDINPSVLAARVMSAGAKRVEVALPAFQTLTAWEAAREGAVAIHFGGLEDA